MPCPRAACLVTVFAQDGAAYLWLKRNRIVTPAIITYDLKPCTNGGSDGDLLRTALWASLRRHHIPLIKNILILLRKNKGITALNTGNFNIGHCVTSFRNQIGAM